ncbi:MAG: hypothetical protein LBK69_08720 [Syntrophomonadaceae bacterium]|jgi:hypothetical protein|nr:hypothetical protein [Syntrophomonadaceae bacterium]
MIPVIKQKEPENFDRDVRTKGLDFLKRNPSPSSREFGRHNYWKNINSEIYQIYKGICAYTGEWFSSSQSNISIDHFIPKTKIPRLAYEWDNYRLTTQKMNNNKGDTVGLIDPFEIEFGWFVLDFPSCLIRPNDELPVTEHEKVLFTIKILKLNSDDEIVQNRCNIIIYYINGDISFRYLKDKYPYIAYELERQDLVDAIQSYFMSKPTV